MKVDQHELGRRLRVAREACRMTQEDVAERIGVQRLTYANMENGKRTISSLELDQLARLYGRDMRDFVAEEFRDHQDPLSAIFRAHSEATAQPEVMDTLRGCLDLGRELAKLERMLGIHRNPSTVASYPLPIPRNRWEAIEHGIYVAAEERRRLGLGNTPMADMADFLEAQGIRVAVENLPDHISGITLTDRDIGLFVMVNRMHPRERRRFSHAHEYGHVLLDRDRIGMVSNIRESSDLLEVRANAFAASFLMPEDGIRHILSSLGKGRASRFQADVFDGADGALHVEGRTEPGSQQLQFVDVVHLAHCFGVSRAAMLYRLRNLGFISRPELDHLRDQDRHVGTFMESILGIEESPEQQEESRNAFRRLYVRRALEALMRNKITSDEFLRIADHCTDIPRVQLEAFIFDLENEEEDEIEEDAAWAEPAYQLSEGQTWQPAAPAPVPVRVRRT